ncbi:nuclear transport factor 2 family protein [Luteimonas gilva]|uniref:Nuclear transport factor 2 family protein n=1 Tax=Luteimonas gilva TaxID=2572684 RepID=A0A4U5JN62_9GAMM|nr:nuclear transport factor 2 family protein [Luteimonas gilva]TKR29758.1 nuclear transport factor 2 family protein [Luteimonas gilva]
MKRIALSTAVGLVFAAPAMASDVDAGIAAAIKTYDETWDRKDLAGLEAVLAPEYVYFSSKGGVLSRQQWLDRLSNATYRLDSTERGEMDAHVSGTAAVVGTRWKGHGTSKGKPFRDDQRCSMALTKASGEWKVLSEHCTQIVP